MDQKSKALYDHLRGGGYLTPGEHRTMLRGFEMYQKVGLSGHCAVMKIPQGYIYIFEDGQENSSTVFVPEGGSYVQNHI